MKRPADGAAEDIDDLLASLEEQSNAEKKTFVQTITSKPVMKKRTKEDVSVVAPRHSPAPTQESGAGPVPPPPPPAPPSMSDDKPAGVIPPPPPAYGMHEQTMPIEMVPSRPAPNPILPVPKQYQANADKSNARPKTYKMSSCGAAWEDQSLHDWPGDDHRIFVGDLGNECNDDLLAQAFQHYKSFQKAKVIRERNTGKSRGYGFVSFLDVEDFMNAMRSMNGKYIGNRPIKLRKSTWQERMNNSEKNQQKKAWQAKAAPKSKKHMSAVHAPKHRHGR